MSVNACAALVEKGDPDRFLASMAAPPNARLILFPLYAFALEVARAPWMTEEPMIAEMRLQWWRDALEEIGAGGPVRRHEVVTPLSEVLDPEAAQLLDQTVAVRRWDIYKDAFEDQTHFANYVMASSGHLMWIAARLLGADRATENAVRDVGWAFGVQRWLQAIPSLEDRGRKPLVDGRAAAVSDLAQTARNRLQKGRKGLDRAGRIAALSAFQSNAILRQAVKRPARVALAGLATSEMSKRFRLFRRALFL